MRDLSNGTNVQAKGFLDAQTRVSTRYTITLWRWEMLVQAGATDMDWALVALSPEHDQDAAYHEYFLVLQSERGVPVRISQLQFGTTFRNRVFLFDDFSDISVRLRDIQLSPPDPRCPDGFHFDGSNCVSTCPESFYWFEGECFPDCPDGYELVDDLCFEECPFGYIRDGIDCLLICGPEQINIDNVCEEICDDGSISTDGVCLNEICPDGYQFESGVCEPICMDGEIWVNQSCQPNCSLTGMVFNGQTCVCPEGTENINGRCVTSCQEGTRFNGSTCEPICSQNQVLVNGLCQEVTVDEPACPEGETLSNGSCIPICPNGYMWTQGRCQLSCTSGYIEQYGVCVPESCPDNSRLIEGICVSCPLGTTLANGECIVCNPNAEDCTQQLINKEDAEGCSTNNHHTSKTLFIILLLGLVCRYRRRNQLV